MKKIIIYSPIYLRNSAGIYCLYKIAKDIKDLGHIVFTTIWNSNNVYPSIFDVPIIPNIVAKQLIDDYNFSILYPEVISGNPLGAKNIIRWIMNVPRAFGVGDSSFDDNENIFTYNRKFSDKLPNKICGILTLPTIDVELFKYNESIQKNKITVYTGKSYMKPGYILHYDNIITRTTPDHDTIADILKCTKILYSFDCTTNIINEARLAGCNVVLINDGTIRNNTIENEYGDYGISIYSSNVMPMIDSKLIYEYMNRKIYENLIEYKKLLKNMLEFVF